MTRNACATVFTAARSEEEEMEEEEEEEEEEEDVYTTWELVRRSKKFHEAKEEFTFRCSY